MVRLSRALLALLALAGAVLLAIAPPALGIDLQGGAFLELVVTDPDVPAEDALAQVRRGAESLGFDAQARLRGDAIILEATDATEADVDRIERAVQGIGLAIEWRHVVASIVPSWLGLPLLRALALAAALLGALAAARARASAWWLPVIPGVAGLPLTAALLGALGGTLTLATYTGATPACMAAAVVVGCAAHRGSRGGALRRRILAAWPGWVLLVGSAGAAIAMESTRGFWRGVAAGGVAALLPAVTLALLGVVAAGEVGRRGERDPATRPG